MNVLQVVPELDAGGVERTTIEIAEALSAHGHVAHVASAGGRLEEELTKAGGILHRLNIGSKNPLSLRGNTKALIKIIRDNKIDIVHARSRAPAWPASAAAKATHVPFITTYHGIYNAKSRLKRGYNAVMAKGDIVIANSIYTKRHIMNEHGLEESRIRVIPRGVNMDIFDPRQFIRDDCVAQRRRWGVSEHTRVLLLPGRLTRWKGQLVAMEAFANLAKEIDNIALVLLGDAQGRDGYVRELKEKAEVLNIADKVVFAPHSRNMPLSLASSHLVIVPSVEPEAFGRVIIEAQAMEKLVVASAHGGAMSTMIDGFTGMLVPPGDVSKLADAIKSVLNMPVSEYVTNARAARMRIGQYFSENRMKQATLDVYEEVLTDKHSQ